MVETPAWGLVWAFSMIKSPDGRTRVRGWYDEVEPFTPQQSRLLKKIPFHGENFLREFGTKQFLNAHNSREALLHYLTEPTCTICGFKTGYQGPGSKTVLPGSAMLKMDFRLVYDQNPRRQLQRLKKHLHSQGFDDIKVKALGFLEPSRTSPSAPIARAAEKAARLAYATSAVAYPRMAAS